MYPLVELGAVRTTTQDFKTAFSFLSSGMPLGAKNFLLLTYLNDWLSKSFSSLFSCNLITNLCLIARDFPVVPKC